MNIIYEVDNNNLRLISFNPYTTYQLDELKFYISKEYSKITPFLLIQDSKNKDIIKLSQIDEDKNYNIYSVALTSSIALQNRASAIKILGVYKDSTLVSSNLQEIDVDFENYTLTKKIALLDELNRNIISYYQKIEQLTKMNIEIYQNIEEAVNK